MLPLVGSGFDWRRQALLNPQNLTEALQPSGPRLEADSFSLFSQGTGEYAGDHQSLPRLEVRSSPGKGLGLFAVNRIPAYTKILEDDALISLAKGEDLPHLWEKYTLLPPDLKQQYDGLSFFTPQTAEEETLTVKLEERGYGEDEAKTMARVSSRFQANAFKTSQTELDETNVIRNHLSKGSQSQTKKWASALFPIVARINHSCIPNAHAHYRPSAGSQVIFSLMDIAAGTEIRIAYFDMTMARANRQARATSWGFTCDCPACSRCGLFEKSDYEEALGHIHRSLAPRLMMTTMTPSSAEKTITDVEMAVDLAHSTENKWLVSALPNLYQALAVLEMMLGRTEKSRQAMETALQWECKTTGHNSPSCQEKQQALRSFQNNSWQVV